MNINQIKYELQHLISGKSGFGYDALIQAVARHLGSGKRASPMAEEKHENKPKEAKRLLEFARQSELIIDDINQEAFVSAGAEQKVYINDDKSVIKLNDAIYYASWEDYFHNLLLHNYFFSDTAYHLLGFHWAEDTLFSVVEQPFVKADEITDLEGVKSFMTANGFIHSRKHDYRHPELGIIIEDLHDENVLTQKGLLYFIDTACFIEPAQFWA
ncbi:hypothetical protein [Phaeodactylibacter sp.]|nr:hypothetical protein [Phaeodactylibacter sp.]MCI4648922.1 hypothetical protein [Phaeodactylibacter sp.]MCI5092656.1 hypothetical protein [Phaeodactylibacter sp.]